MTFRRMLSSGLALFAMLFGAGNIVFPLVLGSHAGDKFWYALGGFAITGLCIPFIGVIAALMYQGDYKKLFNQIGVLPGSLLIAVCMMLLGPFGCIPRCITIAHGAVRWHFPSLELTIFSAAAALFVFLFASRKTALLNILGTFLGPIKLTLLLGIVAFGAFAAGTIPTLDVLPRGAFLNGLFDGYGTMDLLGALFFAGILARGLVHKDEEVSKSQLFWSALATGLIGITLLGLVYGGFFFVSAAYADSLIGLDKSQLLSSLATTILGAYGGMVANATIALSCLTTAIALTSVFADYLRKLSGKRIPYLFCVAITAAISGVMTTLGFQRIMELISPMIAACYPVLLILALVGLMQKTIGIKIPRHSMYGALALLMLMRFF